MQARRQDCRISSKPLVVFVPKTMLAGRLHVPVSNDAVGVTPRRRWRRGDCPAFASRSEGWPWSCGPPGGGQLRGGICVPFPSVCRTAASGLRWRFCVFRRQSLKAGLHGTGSKMTVKRGARKPIRPLQTIQPNLGHSYLPASGSGHQL